MSGYAPLFSSLTTGTLCGKWPDIGLWPIVLSLADKRGIVDVTPDYLSRVTGLQIEAVAACMERFCEPDPFSRSTEEEGRRLMLLEPGARSWGWRVVNHGLYRERARKMAYDTVRTESGRDAQRKKASREAPRSPDESRDVREVPLSNANTNTEKKGTRGRSRRVPTDFQPDLEYARTQIPDIDAEREAQKFRDWEFKRARCDWPAVWRTWVENCRESGKYARRKEAARGNGLPILNG